MDPVATPAIETRDLAIRFGGVKAVDGVNLVVPVGQTRAVIGPNGAGKTTLFNLIAGHLKPTRGTVLLFGQDVTRQPTHERTRAGVSRTFQLSNLFGQMTATENVALAVMGDDPATRRRFWQSLEAMPEVMRQTSEVLARFELTSVADRRVGQLAYGQQRVLELAMAVASNPRVLLLDEPTSGVSRREAQILTGIITELAVDLTILLVEHDMEVAFALADEVTVMVEGRELLTAPPDEVRGNDEVIAAYLGRGSDAA